MWSKEKIIDELGYKEFMWLYGKMKSQLPQHDCWKGIDENIQQLKLMNERECPESIANLTISTLRGLSEMVYTGVLNELRTFSVSVTLPTGETITLAVAPFEEVLEVKRRIHGNTGLEIERQRLFNNRFELENTETLEGRLVVSGTVFTLLIEGQGFELFVQGMTSKLYVLRDLQPDTTVPELKKKISEKEGINPCAQVLKYQQYNLDDNRTLGSYGVRQGSTVSVTGRLRGG